MHTIINIYFMYCILSVIAALSICQNGNCSSSFTSKPFCFGAYTWISQLWLLNNVRQFWQSRWCFDCKEKFSPSFLFSNWWLFLSFIGLILSSASSTLYWYSTFFWWWKSKVIPIGNYFFFTFTFFSSDHLLSSSMKSCYFSTIHLTICLIVWLNTQSQTKAGQQELTNFHSCPEQHRDQQRVRKLSLFPVIC